MQSTDPTLQRTERDGILLLTLNRPEARNAMNFELATALAAAMDELDAREDLRLGIITGSEGTFCAGMDLKAFLKGSLPSIANFGLPEVKRGLVAGAGGLVRLPRRLPFHVAMECALTGAMLSAQRAHAYGLVNRLTEPGQALATAQELGSAIAANGPLAIATTKQVIMESADWPTRDMFELQRALTGPVFTSADAREGAVAFAEKRKPVWTGK